MAVKIKKIIIYTILWLSSTAIAFYFGTFHPNQKVILDIEHVVALDIQEDYSQAKFLEPEFIYNDNQTFMMAVNTCIDFVNLTIAPSDRIHKNIIVAMAVLESGYGTSRFAKKGNNLFGIRTWDKSVAQMKPQENPNAEWGVKTYITKCKSVADMISILNRLDVYKSFRMERHFQLESGTLDLDKQIDHLNAWSTNPNYTSLVKQKAKQAAEVFAKN